MLEAIASSLDAAREGVVADWLAALQAASLTRRLLKLYGSFEGTAPIPLTEKNPFEGSELEVVEVFTTPKAAVHLATPQVSRYEEHKFPLELLEDERVNAASALAAQYTTAAVFGTVGEWVVVGRVGDEPFRARIRGRLSALRLFALDELGRGLATAAGVRFENPFKPELIITAACYERLTRHG